MACGVREDSAVLGTLLSIGCDISWLSGPWFIFCRASISVILCTVEVGAGGWSIEHHSFTPSQSLSKISALSGSSTRVRTWNTQALKVFSSIMILSLFFLCFVFLLFLSHLTTSQLLQHKLLYFASLRKILQSDNYLHWKQHLCPQFSSAVQYFPGPSLGRPAALSLPSKITHRACHLSQRWLSWDFAALERMLEAVHPLWELVEAVWNTVGDPILTAKAWHSSSGFKRRS